MFFTLRKWFDRNKRQPHTTLRSLRWIPKENLPTHPLSHPYSFEPLSLLKDGKDCVVPPGVDSRVLFPFLRKLRDYIPDVSAGVWAWVRLCSTPQSFSFSEGNESQLIDAKKILFDLDKRIYSGRYERERGIETLVQNFFLSVFTYGSFCGEIVLDNSRQMIESFVVIDPSTIRFKLDYETRKLRPYQIREGSTLCPLNPASCFYFGLDTDGLSPYGRSPLLALPLVVKLQQQLLQDMSLAQHNAGYPTVHFRMTMPEQQDRELENEYNQRLSAELESLRDEVREKRADSNLVTFDNVEIQYVGPNGHSVQWSESIQAISEQVISALHLAPFMIGRNWGTTQSWGTAQYQLLTNNAKTVQEGAKRLAEWIRNLELILHGSPITVTHHFAPHHHLDVYDRARAFKTSADTLISLSKQGLLDENTAKQRVETLLRFL